MSPKILLEEKKERKIRKSDGRKKRGEGRRTMAALLVFMLTSLEIVVERKNCLRGSESSILAYSKIQL